ncbi:MAG TPA: hypothetical protein VI485_33180 [Vicinamibacterales bacterium]|nr:hypothetical protein [Vicinamibacterales bacterium]
MEPRSKLAGVSAVCLLVVGVLGTSTLAQREALGTSPSARRETVVPAPKRFPSADEHYKYLLAQAKGGTRHTLTSLPDWTGIWQSGITTMSMRHPVDAPMSPEYRARYDEKQRQEREIGEVYYDRLTHCEPSAYPRWLVEPYHKDFALRPEQSWLMQEFMNETRRIYTDGRPHATPDGHSWLGDSVGFWHGDKLVVWTTGVKAADYLRGYPDNSAALEGIEVWQRVNGDGKRPDRIVVQATMYDPVGLTAPWNVAMSFEKANYEYRIRYWDCALTSNDVKSKDGTTTTVLPGEEGFKAPQTEVTRPADVPKR